MVEEELNCISSFTIVQVLESEAGDTVKLHYTVIINNGKVKLC